MISNIIDYYQARFEVDEEGATMIEYGLLAALIGAALVGVLIALEVSLTGIFEFISGALDGAAE